MKKILFPAIGLIVVLVVMVVSINYLVVGAVDALSNGEHEDVQKFETGEIVYLKPDSTKAVITSFFAGIYFVDYVDAIGVVHSANVTEKSILSYIPVDTVVVDTVIINPYEEIEW